MTFATYSLGALRLILVVALCAAPARALAPQGEALAAELGCGACHAGLPSPEPARARAPSLGSDAAPLPGRFIFEYLADPRPRRDDIGRTRMPDFRLSEPERLALALALGDGDEGLEVVRSRHPEVDGTDGERLYRSLGCTGCHGLPDSPGSVPAGDGNPEPAPAVGPDLGSAGFRYRPDWLRGFLAEPVPVRPAGHRPGSGTRMPDFRLRPDELEALVGYLRTLDGSVERPTWGAARSDLPELTPWGSARAEEYLTDRLACLGCHTWRGEGGRIAPPLDGITRRLQPAAVVRAVHDPGGSRPGSVMPRSPFVSRIVDAVTALLVSDTLSWSPAAPPEIPWEERMSFIAEEVPRAGRRSYLRRCAQCHGTRGAGGGFNASYLPVAPTAHTDGAAMSLRPDDTLYDGIAAGGWILDRSHRMPAFGRSLDRDRIRSLVEYIRELCDCTGPSWSRGGG